jgi:sugar phosphate isomerase/epimerase
MIVDRYPKEKIRDIMETTIRNTYQREMAEQVFGPSLADPDNGLRAWRIKYTKTCIDMAASLGATNISITSGRMKSDCPPADAKKIFTQSLKELIGYGEKKKISIGLEYEPGLLLENAEETIEIINDIDSPYLGVNLDIGHSVVAGENPVETVKLMGSRILNIHLEDISRKKHYHLIPGEGDIPLRDVCNSLLDIGYNRFVTIELYTYKDNPDFAAESAFKYFKDDGSKLFL